MWNAFRRIFPKTDWRNSFTAIQSQKRVKLHTLIHQLFEPSLTLLMREMTDWAHPAVTVQSTLLDGTHQCIPEGMAGQQFFRDSADVPD